MKPIRPKSVCEYTCYTNVGWVGRGYLQGERERPETQKGKGPRGESRLRPFPTLQPPRVKRNDFPVGPLLSFPHPPLRIYTHVYMSCIYKVYI